MSAKVEVEFQPARPEDIEAVVSMMRALETDDPNKKPFDEARRRSSYLQFMDQPTLGRAWLLKFDGQFAGYLVLAFVFSFEYGGRNAFIDELYVGPGHRRLGIGSAALQFAEKIARAEGLAALHLEVSRNNAGAHKLYRRAGFVDHDRYLLTKWLDERIG
jgi:ribosomal protein S18 acetylase RimI-like enzyme